MHILLVEDVEETAGDVIAIIEKLPGNPKVTVAESRETATNLLADSFFDLLILDLKIPSVDGAADEEPIFGLHVFRSARRLAPGTPIIILTGSSAEDFVDEMLGGANQHDVWKTGEQISTVKLIKKLNIDQLPGVLQRYANSISALSSVELDSRGIELLPEYDRLLRIFGRGCGGAKIIVTQLGGLSDALVAKLHITDSNGAPVHDAVVKLGLIAGVKAEAGKYDKHIVRLDRAATPRKIELLEFGAKGSAGLFYQLASTDFTENGFSIAITESEAASAIPSILEGLLAPWSAGTPQKALTVRDIRLRTLRDEDLELIVAKHGLAWVAEFEKKPAQILWCCIHGDLHGENVLATPSAISVMIDYGDVGDGPRSLDPIALEFSMMFHPKGPLLNKQWPTVEQARQWYDLDVYLKGCPYPNFVRKVREWVERAAASRREVAATAYSYLIRQLKYDTTDGKLALAMLEGVQDLYKQT